MNRPTCFGSRLSKHCQMCDALEECNHKRMEGFNYIVSQCENGYAAMDLGSMNNHNSDDERIIINKSLEDNSLLVPNLYEAVAKVLIKEAGCYFNRKSNT